MDSEFFNLVRRLADASVQVGPRIQLPSLKFGWRVQDGSLEVLWPDGSTWIRYQPTGTVSEALVARIVSEGWRRMNLALGVEVLTPYLHWLAGGPSAGAPSVAEVPLFFLPEVLTFDPAPDLSLDLQVLPPNACRSC